MSIIFGILKSELVRVEDRELLGLARATEQYALNGTFTQKNGTIGMGCQPSFTHERGKLDAEILIDRNGNMVSLDGRIDNFSEICGRLEISAHSSSDSSIVLAAFERWGEACFSHLVGDWAIALWWNKDLALYLARDHAGTRTLFFRNSGGHITWATCLESLFPLETSPSFDMDYAACYLTGLPTENRTVYTDAKAILPSHYLRFQAGAAVQRAHWQSLAVEAIRYRTDLEYEEHFLTLFKQSVDRRTGPGSPILAQLSGGMDSTGIVCLSDHMRRESGGSTQDLLDTVSFFDDSEPSWNEKPYFTLVEQKRGKSGFHVETSPEDRTFTPLLVSGRDTPYLSLDNSNQVREARLLECVKGRGYTTILSGFGGDEVLGGIPTPLPELADHLWSFRYSKLMRQIVRWCSIDRSPALYLFAEVLRFTFSLYRPPHLDKRHIPLWLSSSTRRRALEISQQQRKELKRTFSICQRPSSINNALTWCATMESSPCHHPGFYSRFEYRYPYLDRDLVEFLFALPREQLVIPGRRRALMRRALKGIVPEEILERRRKAFVVRGPLESLHRGTNELQQMFSHSIAGDLGVLDSSTFLASLESTLKDSDTRNLSSILFTIALERLLRTLSLTFRSESFESASNEFSPSIAGQTGSV